jgi:Domain of unknown function (DUF4189)
MRRIGIGAIAAAAAGLAMLLAAAPARADNGAIAYDAASGKSGFSWNQRDQAAADAAAIKGCKSDDCKIVLRLGPRQCGALATTPNGKGWTTAWRKTRDGAKLAALQDCQKRAKGRCEVRGSDCNR